MTLPVRSYRSPSTRVADSHVEGRGLFAATAISRGDVVAIKGGHIVDEATYQANKAAAGNSDIEIADGFHLVALTPEEHDDVMLFLNHSCEPNVGLQGNTVFVAMRDVAAGEELTIDYAMIDDCDDEMPCRCGRPACRGVIRGRDWQLPELQVRYGQYFSTYLLRKIAAWHPVDVTTWYLEMTSPDQLIPARAPDGEVSIVQAKVPSPDLNRFLYTAVGGDWYWYTRLGWDYARWQHYLDRSELETWVAYVSGTPAGYVELEMQADANVEIAYFGLLPGFIGRGLGGHLLTHGIRRGWEMGARRVWVHTCTLDGPNALANYKARGLRVYRESNEVEQLPPQTPGPWPGARR